MEREPLDERGCALTEEGLVGMRAGRAAHPTATLRQIEGALDERWAVARAPVLGEIAVARQEARVAGAAATDRPRCPACGTPLVARGPQTRAVRVHGDQHVHLTRDDAHCPACGAGLFPPG